MSEASERLKRFLDIRRQTIGLDADCIIGVATSNIEAFITVPDIASVCEDITRLTAERDELKKRFEETCSFYCGENPHADRIRAEAAEQRVKELETTLSGRTYCHSDSAVEAKCREMEDSMIEMQRVINELETGGMFPNDGSCDKCGVVPAIAIPTQLCDECLRSLDRVKELEAALKDIADGNGSSCYDCRYNTKIAREALKGGK